MATSMGRVAVNAAKLNADRSPPPLPSPPLHLQHQLLASAVKAEDLVAVPDAASA